jgi:mRNA-degrading endonuclease toxin of MazEF toxin-antitoxin module
MRHNPLIIRYLVWIFPIIAALAATAAEPRPSPPYFNAEQGFKPAQRSFQPIFLQMAGSFEHYGTPANYLRHVNEEAKRVEAAWLKAKGKPAKFRPDYFTEEYIEKLIVGWNQMAPVLALESFSRNSGRQMRYAILGTESVAPADLAALESKLTKGESAEFQRFLAKPLLKKSDLKTAEVFYTDGNGFDKLSVAGKVEMNKRVWRGMMDSQQLDSDFKQAKSGTVILSILDRHQTLVVGSIEGKKPAGTADDLEGNLVQGLHLAEADVNFQALAAGSRDSVAYAHAIKSALNRRLTEIGKQATPQQMKDIDAALTLMFENLLVAAQLELEAGLWDEMLKR